MSTPLKLIKYSYYLLIICMLVNIFPDIITRYTENVFHFMTGT